MHMLVFLLLHPWGGFAMGWVMTDVCIRITWLGIGHDLHVSPNQSNVHGAATCVALLLLCSLVACLLDDDKP